MKAEAIGNVLTYRRFHAGRWITVALNFGAEPQSLPKNGAAHEVLISTHLDRAETVHGDLRLRANEGIVVAAAA